MRIRARFSASLVATLLAAATIQVGPRTAWAIEGDETRFYWTVRLGTAFTPRESGTPIDTHGVQQLTGLAVGLELGRYLGAELTADTFETNLRYGGRTIGESGTLTLMPAARLKYPLLDGRLTPYAIAGVGVGFSQFNDRKRPGIGLDVSADDTVLVSSVGAGIEHLIADNVALGVEARYLVLHDSEITVAGQRDRADRDAVVVAATLKLLLPERTAAARTGEPRAGYGGRVYLGARFGGALPLIDEIVPGVEAEPDNSALGGVLSQVAAITLGADLGRWWGIELAMDGYEMNLKVPGIGTVAEYAVYSVLPQARVRHPLGDGRWVPYALAGVGLSYVETNDRKPHGFEIQSQEEDFGVLGAIGAGLEYFVARNIAVGVEGKYLHRRGHQFTLAGREHEADLDAMIFSFGFRVHFGAPPAPRRARSPSARASDD